MKQQIIYFFLEMAKTAIDSIFEILGTKIKQRPQPKIIIPIYIKTI